jgi:hypothetical protein
MCQDMGEVGVSELNSSVSRKNRSIYFLIAACVLLLLVVVILAIVSARRHSPASDVGMRLLSSRRHASANLCHGFPFKRVINEDGDFVAVVIGAPFRSLDAQERALEMQRTGVPLIGFTSYQNFPGDLRHNPFEDPFHYRQTLDYVGLMRAWCTCFRDPSLHGLTLERAPHQIDLSESDYAEPNVPPQTQRTYDFAYVCLTDAWNSCDDGWQAYCRNWKRAKRILDLVAQRGYKGVLVGRSLCKKYELPHALELHTTRTALMRQTEFWNLLSRCRCLFVPNQYDASPRVISEAIQLTVGVLLNRQILGGWKYIDGSNGAFFDPAEDDATVAARLCALIEHQKSRGFSNASFRERYGRDRTSRRLAHFLNPVLQRSDQKLFLA